MDEREEDNNDINHADAMKRKKDSLTLDFSAGSKKAKAREYPDSFLTSPDVGMLKLGTPELERFIVHQNGVNTLTGTPTQILFPKSVTEEQEAYARGFVDALVELHRRQNPLTAGLIHMDAAGSPFVSLTPLTPHLSACRTPTNALKHASLLASPVFSCPSMLDLSSPLRFLSAVAPYALSSPSQVDTPSRDESSFSDSASSRSDHLDANANKSRIINSLVSPLVDSKPLVSKSSRLVASAPVSPVDMSSQELIKLERKREKNRTAAQRCRYKKLERISRLEARVAELRNQNSELSATANSHKELVNNLRQQIVDHVNTGCQIMLSKDA